MKRFIAITLCIITISISITGNYSKGAGTVVLGWASWQVIATILAVGGLSVYAVTLDEYKEEVIEMGDDLGDWIVNRWNSNNEKVLEVKAELDRIIVDAQIYGRIENMSKDLFSAIKGFIGSLLEKQAYNVPLSSSNLSVDYFLNYYGAENVYRQPTQEHHDAINNYFRNAQNFVVNKWSWNSSWSLGSTSFHVYCFPIDSNLEYFGIGYTSDSISVFSYNKTTKNITNMAYNMYLRTVSAYGDLIKIDVNSFTGIGQDYQGEWEVVINDLPIYNNVNDFLSGQPSLNQGTDVNLNDYVTVGGVNKLWEKYGNLDNLGVLSGEDTISVDVIGEKTWEKVVNGEIALDKVVPLPLVDTGTGVLLDDAYIDDDVEDTPVDTVPVAGELGDYTLGSIVTSVFPFCIPFDLIRLIKSLSAQSEAPRWELPLKSEKFNIDYKFIIDLKPFEPLAEIFRLLQTFLFIFALIVISRKMIGD